MINWLSGNVGTARSRAVLRRTRTIWSGQPPVGRGTQEEAMPLVEWALAPMGHCNPKKEYDNVIASTNHLEILCFVTKPPLARLPKPTKSVLTFCTRQLAQWILSGPWRGRAGILGCPSGGKVRKHYDLGSERSGEVHNPALVSGRPWSHYASHALVSFFNPTRTNHVQL